MAIGSDTWKNAALDSSYGSSHASMYPATVYLSLWDGDPTTVGGVEADEPGYARVAITNNSTNWPNAAGGVKSNGTDITFPATTAGWSRVIDFWALMDGSTGTAEVMDYGMLAESVTPTTPGYIFVFPTGAITLKVR